MANTTKRTRPATELNDKPHIRNYGPMASKGQASKPKSGKATRKGKKP